MFPKEGGEMTGHATLRLVLTGAGIALDSGISIIFMSVFEGWVIWRNMLPL